MARRSVIGGPPDGPYLQTNGWTFWLHRDQRSEELREGGGPKKAHRARMEWRSAPQQNAVLWREVSIDVDDQVSRVRRVHTDRPSSPSWNDGRVRDDCTLEGIEC